MGMFWLMPVLFGQRIPFGLDAPLSWVEWALGTCGIVGGIVMAAHDE
jgi:hypothetical protein